MRKPRASRPRRAARRFASRSPTFEPRPMSTVGMAAMRAADYHFLFEEYDSGDVARRLTPGPGPAHTEWRFIHNGAAAQRRQALPDPAGGGEGVRPPRLLRRPRGRRGPPGRGRRRDHLPLL